MKNYLAKLLILVMPRLGEELWVHLATSEVAMSATLVRQDRTNQHPVYYVSYLFKEPELHYTDLEKLTLRLTLVVQHLWPSYLIP